MRSRSSAGRGSPRRPHRWPSGPRGCSRPGIPRRPGRRESGSTYCEPPWVTPAGGPLRVIAQYTPLGYIEPMLHRLRHANLARGGLILAILALVAAPLRGAGQDHCGPQGAAIATHDPGASGHHQGPIPLHPEDSEGSGDCPHCPADQCASQPNCSVQVAIALVDSETRIGHRDVPGMPGNRPERSSRPRSVPPTPPPQLLR